MRTQERKDLYASARKERGRKTEVKKRGRRKIIDRTSTGVKNLTNTEARSRCIFILSVHVCILLSMEMAAHTVQVRIRYIH